MRSIRSFYSPSVGFSLTVVINTANIFHAINKSNANLSKLKGKSDEFLASN